MAGLLIVRLIYVLWIIVMEISASENITFPDYLYMLCPYTDFCNKTANQTIPNSYTTPCCQTCSCSPDCGLHMNCCFQYQDKYKLIETLSLVCVDPLVGGSELERSTIKYYMVDRCLSEKGNTSSDRNQCLNKGGEVDGAENITPVSSLIEKTYKGLDIVSKNIFVNAECAKCNGIHQYKMWDYEVDCGQRMDFSPTDALNQGFIRRSDRCKFTYISPPTEDWSDKHCYTTKHVSCKETDPHKEDMCQNLRAPFLYEELSGATVVYENIVCAICDGLETTNARYNGFCELFDTRSFGRFSAIIDGSVSKDILKNYLLQMYPSHTPLPTNTECQPHEFQDLTKNECRPLYCPEGMYRTDNGCSYFVKWWTVPYYFIQLKLRPYPNTRLMTSMLTSLPIRIRNKPTKWVQSPCVDDKWTFIQVFAEMNASNPSQVVESIVIYLFMDTVSSHGFDPSYVIPHLSKCIAAKWFLKLGGEVYQFMAELDKYYVYVQDGVMLRQKQAVIGKLFNQANEQLPLPKLYESVSNIKQEIKPTGGSFGVKATKLHFCEQVRLETSEVEFGYGEVRILSNDQVIGDNSYSFNFGENITVSVCLKDYDYEAWRKLQPKTNFGTRYGQGILDYVYLTTLGILLCVYIY